MLERNTADLTLLAQVAVPYGISLRPWEERDFERIQLLSEAEGWLTATARPEDALLAWQRSWPALVAEVEGLVVGFVRAISDGAVTTYIAELLVAPEWRAIGVGLALVDACQAVAQGTRLDLLSMPRAVEFYRRAGFQQYIGFRRPA
ncbi:MAG TPA: GNAT family N-acetyltransferase [Roseiflexaceae bacterium]|nr:GNAT family N-acetyltransferase [Roseiflexaceae bacterium]